MELEENKLEGVKAHNRFLLTSSSKIINIKKKRVRELERRKFEATVQSLKVTGTHFFFYFTSLSYKSGLE